jgi:peptidoglycan hydrolase CwlO-like protein
MSDGGGWEIAKATGIIASLVGFVGTAVKAGQWKGEHEARLSRLEEALKTTVEKLSKVDSRVDGIERELLQTMTALKKDIEYIREYIDEEKKGRRRDA